MLLLGHAAVSARRGPRGTCQETRAALWAPAECGVTARSASDGVDVNGIRVHHRRLQYRRYQCGMFRREAPSRPRIPCVYGLEVGGRRRTWLWGMRVPVAVSRLCRERRATLGRMEDVVVALTCPYRISGAFPHHKLPLAYLRERLLVLHLQLLFQGGVKFPTGGKSGGVKGAPWRRRDACGRADESATRVCVGSHAG